MNVRRLAGQVRELPLYTQPHAVAEQIRASTPASTVKTCRRPLSAFAHFFRRPLVARGTLRPLNGHAQLFSATTLRGCAWYYVDLPVGDIAARRNPALIGRSPKMGREESPLEDRTRRYSGADAMARSHRERRDGRQIPRTAANIVGFIEQASRWLSSPAQGAAGGQRRWLRTP